MKWIVGIAIIIIGTYGLHPLSLEIIEQAQPVANEVSCFPTDYFGTKQSVVNYMSLIQAVGLLLLVAVSVFKPWNKKSNSKQ